MSGVTTQNTSAVSLAFDSIAERYDDVFTETLIGRTQRNAVWDALTRTFSPSARILELNCGTGEDALFLARRGNSVTACDASPAMIAVAKRRKLGEVQQAKIQFQALRNENIQDVGAGAPFDGAFSNFSGLNCVADLQEVARSLGTLVRPGGRVLICVWSRFCLWETLWFLSRANASKAFRRVSGRSVANLNDVAIPVWYPSVRHLRKMFSDCFELRSVRSVGLFVPPSYLETIFRKRSGLVAFLARLDRVFAGLPVFRGAGDHVLLDFERVR